MGIVARGSECCYPAKNCPAKKATGGATTIAAMLNPLALPAKLISIPVGLLRSVLEVVQSRIPVPSAEPVEDVVPNQGQDEDAATALTQESGEELPEPEPADAVLAPPADGAALVPEDEVIIVPEDEVVLVLGDEVVVVPEDDVVLVLEDEVVIVPEDEGVLVREALVEIDLRDSVSQPVIETDDSPEPPMLPADSPPAAPDSETR